MDTIKVPSPVGGFSMTRSLAEFRADAVVERVRAVGAASVLDLGSGPGDIVMRFAELAQIERVTAVDLDRAAVRTLQMRLADEAPLAPHVVVMQGDFCERDPRFVGHDIAIMAESIEHVSPESLSKVENAVFAFARPKHIVITTPNREYNPLLNPRFNGMRHPGHKFEWDRRKFSAWCEGVAARQGYTLETFGMGWVHPAFGAASQGAHFRLIAGA